ncbi:MAG: hypothetical protein CL823_05775 [Crocinitomicaceae bacterium]|nr:hypothetical protein [Crocinitomicaceae bacterium]
MLFEINHQSSFSKRDLIIRLIFGWLVIGLPHRICLFFVGIASMIVRFISFLLILSIKVYPSHLFNFQVNYLKWKVRYQASRANLFDTYPEFGLDVKQKGFNLEIPHIHSLNIVDLLLRTLFGFFYVRIPHFIILFIRSIISKIFSFVAILSIIFTGEYPKRLHNFNVGTIRWSLQVDAYLLYLTAMYPPFTGKKNAPERSDAVDISYLE